MLPKNWFEIDGVNMLHYDSGGLPAITVKLQNELKNIAMNAELSLETINPTKAQIVEIVTGAKGALEKFNPDDENSMELFKSRKKELQQARLTIVEACKDKRAEANAFAKKVIGYEKELLAEITPTEVEMKRILDEIKEKEIREERLAELPERRKMLNEIGDELLVSNDALLEMDHDQFVAYMNERKALQFEKMQEEARYREAEERRQQELRQAEDRARIEAEEKVKNEAEEKINEERHIREDVERQLAEEKRLAEEKIRQEEEDEKNRKDEEERRQEQEDQNELYNDWLAEHGYILDDDNNMKIERSANTVYLYKLIDTFTFDDVTSSTE